MKIKILVGLMAVLLFSPMVVMADSSYVSPEFNTICWRKKDCDEARKMFSVESNSNGWIQEEPCTGEWGKCLPAGKTETEISFGGQKKFENIGSFLTTNYNLALVIAGILAVIMIVVAGIQWVTAGGNSESITGAKKRIGGAVTGLLIAYLSYAVLNTINPALVNLRLPTAWLVRPINLVLASTCVNLEKPTPVAPVSSTKDVPSANSYIVPFKELDLKDVCSDEITLENSLNPFRDDFTKCGQTYLVKDGGGATCKGTKCEDGKFCNNDKCEEFKLYNGKVGAGVKGSLTVSGDKYLDNIYLMVACEHDGKNFFQVSNNSLNNSSKEYNFGFSNEQFDSIVKTCGGANLINGFFFKFEANDTDTSPTQDDEWIGGMSMCKNVSGGDSCGVFGANSLSDEKINLSVSQMGLNGQLIPTGYVKNGFVCDLSLNTKSIPNVGSSLTGFTTAGLTSYLFSDKAIGVLKQLDILKQENYIAGVNYSCPAYDKSAGEYQAKLKKLACKCWDSFSEEKKSKNPKSKYCD